MWSSQVHCNLKFKSQNIGDQRKDIMDMIGKFKKFIHSCCFMQNMSMDIFYILEPKVYNQNWTISFEGK